MWAWVVNRDGSAAVRTESVQDLVSYCTAIKRAVLLLSLAVHRLARPSRKEEMGRVCLSHQWTAEVRSKEWGALLSTQI